MSAQIAISFVSSGESTTTTPFVVTGATKEIDNGAKSGFSAVPSLFVNITRGIESDKLIGDSLSSSEESSSAHAQ
jgi:hypothetical protein